MWALALFLIVALGVVALAANTVLGSGSGSSGAQPPPALYPRAALKTADPILARARTRAAGLAHQWLSAHPARDDAGFSQFALAHIPAPPLPGSRAEKSELATLHGLARTRTPAGDRAATWLELNGKKKIWSLYTGQYQQLVAKQAGDAGKAQVKAARKLAGTLAVTGAARFRRVAPYEVDQTLTDPRAAVDQTAALRDLKTTGARKYSYPSKHAAKAAAAATVLDRLEPTRAPEFDWMAAQVAYSRMYAAGHFPSDVEEGATIGYLVADYELGVSGVAR